MAEPRPPIPAEIAGQPLETLEGAVERLTFADPETHYAVVRLKVKGARHPVTVVGPLAGVQEGEQLHLKGTYEVHPKWGEQFKVVWWYAVLPATVAGIEKYLASGLIKGIGPELAQRLVAHFGAETLTVIDDQPERLKEVSGIGPKRIEQIRHDWQGRKEMRDVVVALQGLGVGLAHAGKIYQRYGAQALEVVTTNPYQLALDIQGLGFLTADRLAGRLNLDPLTPARLAAGLLHVLDTLASDGHVYVPEDELLDRTEELLQVDRKPLARALELQAREGRVNLPELDHGQRGVYKRTAWVAETGVAQTLGRLAATAGAAPPLHLDDLISQVQARQRLELSEEQAQAVAAALKEKVMVITGGPGTGKTTIISCILDLYQGMGARVLLMAPTGRAAKRLSETTAAAATTIHRALEFSPQTGGFKRGPAEPLKAEVVVVDETSMVDIYLMYHLLRAIPPNARLILVGDAHQLPAVGPGNVLKDLMDSGVLRVMHLTQIYRQARESLIVVNAHRINQGTFPVLPTKLGRGDFVFIEADEPEDLKRRLLDLVGREIPRHYGLDPMRDLQVITPMHRGPVGIQNLNHELQQRLNSESPPWQWGGRAFRRFDKVMQLRNNYYKEVFNGDIGQVCGYIAATGQLQVDFDGRVVTYDPGEKEEITLAYAVTVHKAQGSEFPGVLIVLSTHHYMLLQRNLLYTALTRGRRLVVLLGSKRALGMAIHNDRPVKRYTYLAPRLREALGPIKAVKMLDILPTQGHNQK
ncbi:MAG: ATP-dependent RecD-like DNA helicase [Deltaproteobacteria bacterium]|nr:ATP-dependent RecD-like DNA helicase [Deltaproteobacteria bacterium]